MKVPMWQTIGLKPAFCAESLKNIRYQIESTDAELPLNAPSTGISARLFRITDPAAIATFKHLGVRLPGDELSDWEMRAREVPELAVQYFYGAWRDRFVEWEDNGYPVNPTKPWIKSGPLTVAECRQQLEWIDILRYGLLWSLFFDDEPNLSKLIAWPDTDLREDEGLDELTKADCDYYILLCKWLRNESIDEQDLLTSFIRAASKRRPKLLLATLEALAREDRDAFAKAFLEYLKYYQKSEFHTRSIRRCISAEGTILWHIARRRGLQRPSLPESLQHLVLTHETLGIKNA